MKNKPLLCPERLRRVPRQFSWIDQRLVRDQHITRCPPHALALYLLLCTVADAQGLSYYSDARAAGLLSLSAGQLREARAQLVAAGLIAYRAPFYQVLSLDLLQAPVAGPPQAPPPRTSPGLSLAEVLRQMITEGGRAS
jgi:hypothetical protein